MTGDETLRRAEEAELAARHGHTASQRGDEIVSPLADADERVIESALRPKRLTEFTGQARVREQLSLILTSALRRGRPPDHVLLAGPSSGPVTWPPCCPRSARAKSSSSTRSTAWPGPPRRCSTWRWRTSASTW